MLDTTEVIGIIGSVVACLGSAAAVIFTGGKQIGRVEAAIGRLVGIEAKLSKVDEHNAQIGTMSEIVMRMRSDHKELKEKMEETDERVVKLIETTSLMRGRFESKHDDE